MDEISMNKQEAPMNGNESRRVARAIGTKMIGLGGGVAAALLLVTAMAWAEGKGEKAFHAIATDAKGVETDVKNIIFYWEEKVSETAFVPHELREVPVKRGTTTVKIKFDSIKHIDIKPSDNNSLPNVAITLTNGKTGEFVFAIAGQFKGQSEFGEVELPAAEVRKIVFK